MNRFVSLPAVSLIFCIGYGVIIRFNWPMFRYYPLVKRFSWIDLTDKTLGPAMTWYGWMASAAVAAAIGSVIWRLVVPDRWLPKLAPLFWLLPILVIACGYYRERSWLLAH